MKRNSTNNVPISSNKEEAKASQLNNVQLAGPGNNIEAGGK
ncbi:hypothetical protein ACVQ90_08140 [Staphylococcus aureus]